METTPYIKAHADQMGDILFVQEVERRLREGWNPRKIQLALRGTYANFPPELCEVLDPFLSNQSDLWINPAMERQELAIVYISTIEMLRTDAPVSDEYKSDERLNDMFNIMFMKLCRVAHMTKPLRKAWGIKKGLIFT